VHCLFRRLPDRWRLVVAALLLSVALVPAVAAEKALPRKGLPVEIVEEFEAWRKIRDAQGTEGWVHQRMVTGTRNVLITGELRTLRADADAAAPAVARAEPGVIAHLLDCRDTWCRVELQGVKGWLKRSEVWGVYPGEAVP